MRALRATLALILLLSLSWACGKDPVKRLRGDPDTLAVVGRYFLTRADLEATLKANQVDRSQDPSVQSRIWDQLVKDVLVLNDASAEPSPPEPLPLGLYSDPRSRDQVVSALLQEKVYGAVRVEPSEVDRYYQAHQGEYRRGPGVLLREMQITDGGRAQEAYQLLRRGRPFVEVAKEYALSPNVEARYFQYDELPEYLQPILAKTAPGSVTRPVHATPELYQILIVVERTESYAPPLRDLQEAIRLQLADEKGQALLNRYLTVLGERFRTTVFWSKLPFTYREETP